MSQAWASAGQRLILLAATLLPMTLVAQGPVVKIDGRNDCEPRLYEDLAVGIAEVSDTAALFDALGPVRRGLEPVSLTLEYGPTGQLADLRFGAAGRSPTELAGIGARLQPVLRPIPATGRGLSVMIQVDSGVSRNASLRPADLTCLPAIRNLREVTGEFTRRIGALRKTGALEAGTAGRVTIDLLVTTEGRPEDARVHQSSGAAAADTAAMLAMGKARFDPAVAGRRALPLRIIQALRF